MILRCLEISQNYQRYLDLIRDILGICFSFEDILTAQKIDIMIMIGYALLIWDKYKISLRYPRITFSYLDIPDLFNRYDKMAKVDQERSGFQIYGSIEPAEIVCKDL